MPVPIPDPEEVRAAIKWVKEHVVKHRVKGPRIVAFEDLLAPLEVETTEDRQHLAEVLRAERELGEVTYSKEKGWDVPPRRRKQS